MAEFGRKVFGPECTLSHHWLEDVFLAVAKGTFKDVDAFGAHSPKHFDNMSLKEFHDLVCVDLYINGLFGMGPELWDQCTGPAIGGPLSANNSYAVLLGPSFPHPHQNGPLPRQHLLFLSSQQNSFLDG